MKKLIFIAFLFLSIGCSPIKSTPKEEKHQLELTLHGLQTSLDDVRHDLNCFQTEMQILDGRIKYYENALTQLKQQDVEKQQTKIDQLIAQMALLEKKYSTIERSHTSGFEDIQQLSHHANETSAALIQFKNRVTELEEEIQKQSRRFEEIAKLKGHLENSVKAPVCSSKENILYRVRPGDTLEKIARLYKTTAEKIKKLNNLNQDLIVVDQEISIPENEK